jgi:hypothetical protein
MVHFTHKKTNNSNTQGKKYKNSKRKNKLPICIDPNQLPSKRKVHPILMEEQKEEKMPCEQNWIVI